MERFDPLYSLLTRGMPNTAVILIDRELRVLMATGDTTFAAHGFKASEDGRAQGPEGPWIQSIRHLPDDARCRPSPGSKRTPPPLGPGPNREAIAWSL